MNLPDYNFLSAPLWLVTVLHIVTLTIHFIAMNFVVGGVIIALFGRFNDRRLNDTVKKFVRLFPSIMAVTITFGVAPLLFVQLVFAGQIYSASIVSGWFWLMIVFVAIIAYYFLYASSFRTGEVNSRTTTYLAIALIGFIYISFVYSSVFSMVERPDLVLSLYAGNQSGAVINPDLGSYIFRWLHMLAGAVTVGGFFAGLFGRDDESAFTVGKSFYLWGMVVTMVIGLAYLFTMGDFIVSIMRSAVVWWLLVAIVLSLVSLHFFFKKKFIPAGVMVGLSMVGMVTIRHYLRLMRLEGTFDPATLPVRPQWSAFIVFLVCFLIAAGLVWWMLRAYFSTRSKPA